jgi:hypothetical protein
VINSNNETGDKPMTATYTIKVPKYFWDDHKNRDCVQGEYSETSLAKHYELVLSEADLMELLSDAQHYASSSRDMTELIGLVSSGRATRNAIVKQIGADVLAEMWTRNNKSKWTARAIGLPVAF